jgi:hypothetical protein
MTQVPQELRANLTNAEFMQLVFRVELLTKALQSARSIVARDVHNGHCSSAIQEYTEGVLQEIDSVLRASSLLEPTRCV